MYLLYTLCTFLPLPNIHFRRLSRNHIKYSKKKISYATFHSFLHAKHYILSAFMNFLDESRILTVNNDRLMREENSNGFSRFFFSSYFWNEEVGSRCAEYFLQMRWYEISVYSLQDMHIPSATKIDWESMPRFVFVTSHYNRKYLHINV